MEELRKLERAQAALELMHRHGVSPSDPDSDRFLSNLLLLLIQPCGELDMDRKFNLINEYLPKILRTLIKEASHLLDWDDLMKLENKDSRYLNQKSNCSLQTEFHNGDVVGLNAMERANSTLEDFCRSYFMFHEMDVNRPQSFFKYLPVLSFTESYIYQYLRVIYEESLICSESLGQGKLFPSIIYSVGVELDNLNERVVQLSASGLPVLKAQSEERDRDLSSELVNAFKGDPFGPLKSLLEFRGLLNDRINEEFKSGEEFWALERKLCSALMHKEAVSVEDVMRAIHLKSFDYRALNLLLYELRGEKVNELHMEFLSISEYLVEISDDLFDYEDDVLDNSFNILRMFVKIYGASAAPTMLAKSITEAEQKYDRLLKALEPQLSAKYQKRCEEATAEGGRMGGPLLGKWSIPPVIVDEESYRSNM
ncbi:uncharacterized protein LOC115738984 isoform X2 [Rhodamnia argentea]|uniref:Uncharacterized protein LOC115738984 isoform X2 n=1 Tax=Rhodamnia argentea TaxID=178133 RepID=A0ABM3HKG8_9MYRT|nr:uncharacterized protein LOC115738984 isoform X2 [Rhodamnia argentea]